MKFIKYIKPLDEDELFNLTCPFCDKPIFSMNRLKSFVPDNNKPYWLNDGDSLPLNHVLNDKQHQLYMDKGFISLLKGSCSDEDENNSLCCWKDYFVIEAKICSKNIDIHDDEFMENNMYNEPDSSNLIYNFTVPDFDKFTQPSFKEEFESMISEDYKNYLELENGKGNVYEIPPTIKPLFKQISGHYYKLDNDIEMYTLYFVFNRTDIDASTDGVGMSSCVKQDDENSVWNISSRFISENFNNFFKED